MNKKALMLAGIGWNDTWQRHQQIACALASNGYDVIFIERIPSSVIAVGKVIGRLRNVVASKNGANRQNHILDNIKVLRFPFVPPGNIISDFVNRKIVFSKVIPKISSEFDVVINYLPIKTTQFIYESVKAEQLVYDCVRAFNIWGGYPKSLEQDELQLLNSANRILVDSFYLYDKLKSAVDQSKLTQILPTVKKSDYIFCQRNEKKIDRVKSIAYFGSIDEHIDLDLLVMLANEGYKINLFGKIYINDKFLNHDNIMFHGYFSDSEEMFKAILCSSDAIIIPYKGSMDGVIPAKMMQSLATVRPVFISSFYDANKLNEYLYVYKTRKELIGLIKSFDSSEFYSQKRPNIVSLIEDNFEEKLTESIL